MKKTLKTFGLLSILSISSSAANFLAVSYTKNSDDKVFVDQYANQLTFENTSAFNIKIGSHYFPEEEDSIQLGAYLGFFRETSDKKKYMIQGSNQDFQYTNTMLTLGATVAINNYFVLFGGLGGSSTQVEREGSDDNYIDDELKLNVNVGAMMYFYESSFGLIVEYDSEPKTISAGLTFRF